MNEKIPKSFGTHNGSFHADEVTACALLLLFDLIDEENIFRTRDEKVLERCEFVCDVGGVYNPKEKLFDHHQADYQGSLSSAGMVLRFLLDDGVIERNLYDYLNRSLVMGVDAHDNGIEPKFPGLCTFSHVIFHYNPISQPATQEEQDACFCSAVAFTLGHCRRLKERLEYILSSKEVVKEVMDKSSEYLVFERSLPWLDLFFELGGETHPARFIVMPSGEHWKLRAIPPSFADKMNVRTPLPKEWAGLQHEELKEASGISGAIFCHKGRFISVWETKEDAMAALQLILSNRTRREDG